MNEKSGEWEGEPGREEEEDGERPREEGGEGAVSTFQFQSQQRASRCSQRPASCVHHATSRPLSMGTQRERRRETDRSDSLARVSLVASSPFAFGPLDAMRWARVDPINSFRCGGPGVGTDGRKNHCSVFVFTFF